MSINDVTPAPPTPTKSYKAILAFVLSFLASLLSLVQDKTEFGELTPLQWLVAIISAIVVAGGVWAIPNPAKTDQSSLF